MTKRSIQKRWIQTKDGLVEVKYYRDGTYCITIGHVFVSGVSEAQATAIVELIEQLKEERRDKK